MRYEQILFKIMKKHSTFCIALIISGLLLWAIFPFNPYGFYKLLRIVVFCFIGYLLSIRFFSDKPESKKWTAIGVGILYNPILTISLGRPLWSAVNLVTVVLLLWMTKPKQDNNELL